MPFYLYKYKQTPHGYKDYILDRKISLGGHGPIKEVILRRFRSEKRPDWHITDNELLSYFKVSAETHAIIIDLKPNISENISLYQLRDIWAYYENEWCPLALRLETIYVDYKIENPALFKQEFCDDKIERKNAFEFLYLQDCSLQGKGKWQWGKVGSTNGALLWPEAIKYFLDQIKECLI